MPPAIFYVTTVLNVLSAREIGIFTVKPLVLKRDALSGEPSDAFVLLPTYRLDCTTWCVGPGNSVRAKEGSISALTLIASLTLTALHVVS